MALERRRGYRPDHKSFGAFMLSEQARGPAVEAAQDIAAIAKADHRRSASTDGEHMADRIQVERPAEPFVAGNGNPRVYAEVFNDHDHAAAEEFGGKFQQPQKTLGRAGAPFHSPRASAG